MCSFGTDEYISGLVEKYSASLLRAAFAILKNTADAQDAVQEAFLVLIKKQPVFENEEHEKAWLIRVTVNKAKSMLRLSRRASFLPIDELPEELLSEEPEGLNEPLSALMLLPEKYRTVLHLYYYEGYSQKETAAILGKPLSTVETLISRGRARLKKMLEGEYEC